jgi:hypothetical protein
MTNQKRTVKLVSFGNGGDTVYFDDKAVCTGYGSPDKPHAADFTSERKTDCLVPDGTPVIDVRPAVDTDKGFRWAIKGPMVNIDLADDDIDPCPTLDNNIMVHAMMSESGNQFGTLAATQIVHKKTSKEPGPLDSVSIQVFVQGWKEHGAKIGQYINKQIIWD